VQYNVAAIDNEIVQAAAANEVIAGADNAIWKPSASAKRAAAGTTDNLSFSAVDAVAANGQRGIKCAVLEVVEAHDAPLSRFIRC
jgi:hypothetical protein